MADALENSSSSVNSDIGRWFCHSCNSEIVPDLSEFKCPNCGNGFIEAIVEDENLPSGEAANGSSENVNIDLSPAANRPQTAPQSFHPENFTYADSPLSFSFPPPFGFRNTPHLTPPTPFDGFHGFVEQLLFGLMGGLNTGAATFSIQMGPHVLNGNSGDYVFSAEGLDNIVTMLMNQLEGTGPPPAPKEQVDALPEVHVTQTQVDDKLQCHVCMENFNLGEKVKELPCRHVYHGDCITPWLQLHGTCPVCRKRIDAAAAAAANPNNSAFHSADGRT